MFEIRSIAVAGIFAAVTVQAASIEIAVKPIRVADPIEDAYAADLVKVIDELQTRAKIANRPDLALGTPEFDYASAGKIFTLKSFVKMPLAGMDAVFAKNVCRISRDLYQVEKNWSWSKFSFVTKEVTLGGKFRAEAWYPNAANAGVEADLKNGQGAIIQTLEREYSVYAADGKKAYVNCTTKLRSANAEEAESQYKAYAADAYGPLKSALGVKP